MTIRVSKPTAIRIVLLLVCVLAAVVVVAFYQNELFAPADSLVRDPRFVQDVAAIESYSVQVLQPEEIVCTGPGAGMCTGERLFKTSILSPEVKASAYRLLRSLAARHHLRSSFQSIQNRTLVVPMYEILFVPPGDDAKAGWFTIEFYNALMAQPWLEVKHKHGGTKVQLDRQTAAQVYGLFADCIETEHPQTAKELRKIASGVAPSASEGR
ncbi:MAG: hypothetical protein JW809_16940 [Pirellulales bacterium]|nr:hypothetical protein [Pirellulales bacterium]